MIGAVALAGACGVSEPELGEATSAVTVQSFVTTSCTTASVIGLSNQIAAEISCLNPASLTRFSAGSGITIASNAVLPFLAANAKTDLQAVGNVTINSAFRTVAAQYLLLQWFNLGRCGITAAAAVGRSNHESGRAVDVGNFSSRITAMANHGWSHDVPNDPVHFDHLSSADIRGRDTLAFQRLWNRNNPGDKIAEDGAYGPQTEARLKRSPATGFAQGAICGAARAVVADVVAVDGPDKVAPGQAARYAITLRNASAADWPASTRLVVADGAASELYDAASWTSNVEVGALGVAIPAGGQAVIAIDVVAPGAATQRVAALALALVDGDAQVGAIDLAVTVTPDGDEGMSSDADDQDDIEGGSAGCSASGGAGWLAFAPVLLVLRRRRR